MTVAQLEPLLAELADGLVPLVAAAAGGPRPPGGPFGGPYEAEDQRRAVMAILEGVGFDPDGWRLDVAPHPFAQGIAHGDVRITTRYDLHEFKARVLRRRCTSSATASTRRASRARLTRSPLGSPVSLGVHESQSRLWENLVGRSRPFCAWALPQLAAELPGGLRRRHPRRPLPRRQPRLAQPDPRRGRRDDLQPPHHPALPARAGADRRLAVRRRPPARVERGHAPAARPRRARRRPGACSRTSTGAPG